MKLKIIFQNFVFKVISFFNNFNYTHQFLLFSDPRGGSTWLAQIISSIPNSAVIWEPLNITENSIFKKMGFGWRQYIPEEENWQAAKTAFKDLFQGKILNKTIVFFEVKNLFKYWSAKNLVIKFVNGNALIPWLCVNFNFKYKPIFLIRHPYSVISSQLKHGAWQEVSHNYGIPAMRYNDSIKEHEEFLSTIETLEGKLAAEWCIVNLPTLRNINNNKEWITVNYENLVLNPETEILRIFKEWNIDIPDNLLDTVKVPSRTTREGSPIDGKAQLSHWRKKLNAEQKHRISQVMKYFEVEFYNEDHDMPLVNFE